MNEPIILVDGKCKLCNSGVNFVLARDRKKRFKFSTLDSKYSQNLLQEFGGIYEKIDSVLLVDDQKVYIKSAAVLQIAKHLGGLYPLFYLFVVIPPVIRDYVYDVIAKNRYKWFGKNDTCDIIPPDEDRFL